VIATQCPAVYKASLLAQRFVMLLREKKEGTLGTKWGTKRYLDMERLREQEVEELTAQTA